MLQQIIKPDNIHLCYFGSVWAKRITTLTAAKTKYKSIFLTFYIRMKIAGHICPAEVVLQHQLHIQYFLRSRS